MDIQFNEQGYPLNLSQRGNPVVRAGECGIAPDEIPAGVYSRLAEGHGVANESIFRDDNGACHWVFDYRNADEINIYDVVNNGGHIGHTASYMESSADNVICDYFAPNNDVIETQSCDYFKNGQYSFTNTDLDFDFFNRGFDITEEFIPSHADRLLPNFEAN